MGKLVCPWGRDTGTGKLALAHGTHKVRRDDAPVVTARPGYTLSMCAASQTTIGPRDERGSTGARQIWRAWVGWGGMGKRRADGVANAGKHWSDVCPCFCGPHSHGQPPRTTSSAPSHAEYRSDCPCHAFADSVLRPTSPLTWGLFLTRPKITFTVE